MHLTLHTTPVVIGFWLASASCSSRLPIQVTATESTNESARGNAHQQARVILDSGVGQDVALNPNTSLDLAMPDSSSTLEPDALLTFNAGSDTGFEAGSDAGFNASSDTGFEAGAQSDAGTACLSGSEVSVVGCDSILQNCPLDTELVLLCFSIWNKSRSQVMQSTLACFEAHGCEPGAADALNDCFAENSRRACVEDRQDCAELSDTCELLAKASCEATLAPFHDSIREKTLTCVREETAVQASEADANCRQTFEDCLSRVSAPVTL